MLPNPLHPAVVHFPLVLALLLPVAAMVAVWTIRRGTPARRAWSIPLVLAAVLAVSAWAAVQTGAAQEERVEQVVPDQPLHGHEEAGETFLMAAAVLLLLVGAGMLPARAGTSARVLSIFGSLVLVAGAIKVGHSGGELVYRHGAASAYAGSTTTETADGALSDDEREPRDATANRTGAPSR